MAADAIALIVAGSGEASDKEIFDLLNDKYDGETDVTLIVPIDKDHFSKAVESAVEWFTSDEQVDPKADIATVLVGGGSVSRKASDLGEEPEEVDKFVEIFGDEFDGFDRVDFVIALPDPPTEDAEDALLTEFDEHVDWVEAALGTKRDITVLNLCRGLDDVVLTEPEEPDTTPEPEPEPEPEKPARKPRASRAKDPVKEVVENAHSEGKAPDINDVKEAARKSRSSVEVAPEGGLPSFVLENLNEIRKYFRLSDEAAALFVGEEYKPRRFSTMLGEVIAVLEDPSGGEETTKPSEAPQEAQDEPLDEPQEAPKRGRGRPRENFEQREHWDQDEKQWVKPGKGRARKGTKWRIIDTRDNSILDEGVA